MSDSIIGAVAFEFAAERFQGLLADSEFTGALFVLSHFTAPQLAGFVEAAKKSSFAPKLEMKFPAAELGGLGLPADCLVDTSAVGVRLADRHGKVVFTSDNESDVGASLGNKVTIEANQLKDGKSAARIWATVLCSDLGLTLPADLAKQAQAMIGGLLSSGQFAIGPVASFLYEVLKEHKKGTKLETAAGRGLPDLDLPLYERCFLGLSAEKAQPASHWRKRFEAHGKTAGYLDKRRPDGLLLDPNDLARRHEQLLEDDPPRKVPDKVLDDFKVYIQANGTRGPATETLLFKNDWETVRHCFEQERRTSGRDFVENTRAAIKLSSTDPSAPLSSDDELVLDSLEKNPRKSGGASDEFREFLEKHVEAIQEVPTLLLEWEDFVYGRRIDCEDLVDGIVEFLQRTLPARESGRATWVVLEGDKQDTPLHFVGANPRACAFFERHYGGIERHSGRKVRFERTLLPEYSVKVKESLEKIEGKKGRKDGKKAVFSFYARLWQEGRKTPVATLPLRWSFPQGSVLSQEGGDLTSILRFRKNRKTALVAGLADYETVGRKGTPLTLSIHAVEGFASSPGALGRGSFIPAQAKIVSLAGEFGDAVKRAEDKGLLSPEDVSALEGVLASFDGVYGQALEILSTDTLAETHVPAMTEAYRVLLECVRGVGHETLRRQLVKIILRIGVVEVAESGHRPKLAIVCPWHPFRIQAAAARNRQTLTAIRELLSDDKPAFSDEAGRLFFREMREMSSHPLQPEVVSCWENSEAHIRVATQSVGAYTLHEPVMEHGARSLEDNAAESADTIMGEVEDYLRLQPHERDNLAVMLYNCDSPELPNRLVQRFGAWNRDPERQIRCQILLTHHDENHLRQLYRDIVARSGDGDDLADETDDGFLSKVRVNITAANQLKRIGRTQPVDIAYCRDLLSAEARTEWEWVPRETLPPERLRPYQWSRAQPFREGEPTVKVLLCCPTQSELGWAFLHAVGWVCGNSSAADSAWKAGKCVAPMRTLNFNNAKVDRVLRETHELAAWVVNQDELLDRRLLEQKKIKVIRYIQRATQGRNLVISSDARDTLLVNALRERLNDILPSGTDPVVVGALVRRLIDDANEVSGGLALRAARRANNANELLGVVLSRYLVESELGPDRIVGWCFLDDYSHWLGKREGGTVADLLVLSPALKDGHPHLDIAVTEAKFIEEDGLASAKARSSKQLCETLVQVSEALSPTAQAADQEILLGRLSDLLLSRTTCGTLPGKTLFDPVRWRSIVRQGECSFSVWGYSHIFVHAPATATVSSCRGIETPKARCEVRALQEIFGPDWTREILLHLHENRHKDTELLRRKNGHPDFNVPVRKLSPVPVIEARTPPPPPPPPPVGQQAPGPAPSPTGAQAVVPATPDGKTNSNGQMLAFLAECAARAHPTLEAGKEWLETVTTELRQALLTRGMSAKLAEDFKPILTPNAAIIKLQGSKDMTVAKVESRVDEIFTSNRLQIISVTPESGRVSIAIARPDRQVLLSLELLNTLLQRLDALPGEHLFVGVREEDGQPMLVDTLNMPHSLIAGMTGSGKSVLIQNLILYVALTRSPLDALIYLIDAKFGIDYRPLDLLPHVCLGSKKIIEESGEALETLGGLVDEMERRYQLFKEARVKDYRDYRKATGKELPALWVIHDEFADWMQTEEYAERIPQIVGRLSIKARAAGIFLIFAAQRPDNRVMPVGPLRSQLGNRLVLKVDSPATSEIAMGQDGAGAEKLLGKGHMLVKTGDTPQPVFVQVPYLDMQEDVPKLVQYLRVVHGMPLDEGLPAL